MARLVEQVLAAEAGAGRITAGGLCLNTTRDDPGATLTLRSARGQRARFLWGAQRAALSHSHFIYDFLGMARAHAHFLRRPFLTWIHGIEAWDHARPDRLTTAARAAFLLANSAFTKNRAERLHGGFSRAQVCWLATETDAAPALAPAIASPPTVLLVGRMDPDPGYKGHRELIQAWPAILAAVPQARLVFIGDGPGRPALERIAAARAPRILFRGFVPEREMDAAWVEATVLAMPSRGEGFGLVYIEAMRHGVPIVASIHDAAPEINLEGVTGFNVSLDAPEPLIERVRFLLQNRGAAAALGRNGYARWREHFQFSSFRERFLPHLHAFLQSRA